MCERLDCRLADKEVRQAAYELVVEQHRGQSDPQTEIPLYLDCQGSSSLTVKVSTDERSAVFDVIDRFRTGQLSPDEIVPEDPDYLERIISILQ
jgi:hypothetical protein